MRVLVWAGLISLLLLWPAACTGGSGNGAGEPAGDDLPTLVFEDDFVAPFNDSGLPATVAARVAQTITAQDAALATAVAEGVNRVARLDEVSPTPTSLAEDEVRVPVFRRGSRPLDDGVTSTPVPPATPVPSATVSGDGQRRRFSDPAAAGYVEVRPVTATAGSDAAALFERFRQDVAHGVTPRLVSYAVDDAYGHYGLTYEYLHYAPPPADCPERVTAKVHVAERRSDARMGYAVIFAVCDGLSAEYEALKIGVLSGFREGTP